MKDYPLTVPAGGVISFNCFGSNQVYCDVSDVPEFELRVDSDPFFGFFAGRKLSRKDFFKTIEVKNPNPTAMHINLVVGDSDIADSTTTINGTITVGNAIELANPVVLQPASAYIGTPDVNMAANAKTMIKALTSGRLKLLITNLPTNTVTFRISGNDAGVDCGAPLAPGDSITLDGEGAAYGFNPTATAQKLSVVEVF